MDLSVLSHDCMGFVLNKAMEEPGDLGSWYLANVGERNYENLATSCYMTGGAGPEII